MIKKYYICIIIAFCMHLSPNLGYAQSYNKNFIVSEIMLDSTGKTNYENITYFDGIGRKKQIVSTGQNTNKKNLFTVTEYNYSGQESHFWQPLIGARYSNYIEDASLRTASQNTYNDANAYSDIEYDALGRPIAKTISGEVWHQNNKKVTIEYITNNTRSIRKYSLNSYGNPKNSPVEYYQANSLIGEKVTDEDGHTIETYKDLLGNIILERRNGNNDTYYVYDKGRLRVVIPPLYQTDNSIGLLYKYKYDGHGRCIEKTLPGANPIKYSYDKNGKVAFMQDGTMRSKSASTCRFFLYDGLGRLAIQGMCTGGLNSTDTLKEAKVVQENGREIAGTGYALCNDYILINPTIEVVNYYDGYSGLNSSIFSDLQSSYSFPTSSATCTTTLQTAQILSTTKGELTFKVFYYDSKGRLTETRTVFPSQFMEKRTTTYTFTSKPLCTSTDVYKNGVLFHSVKDSLKYAPNTELVTHEYVMIDNQSNTCVAENSYDDLGRLSSTNMGGSLLSTSYQYDLHGWLTSIASIDNAIYYAPIFVENMYYANGFGSQQCYNGNISSITYKNDGQSYYSTCKGYNFTYDGLNRLTSSIYKEGEDLSQTPSCSYSETMQYNKNSAITSLTRTGRYFSGAAYLDNLSITYYGNAPSSITDTGVPIVEEGTMQFKNNDIEQRIEYSYDTNGSLVYDTNKGIAKIEYDFNNMPKRIQFTNGNVTEYEYAADGRKLKTLHRTAVDGISVPLSTTHILTANETLSVDSTLYIGNFEIKGGNDSRYYFSTGYAELGNSNQQSFHYFFKDHLGNIRTVVNANGTVEQVNNYYPSGVLMNDTNIDTSGQTHKYNGKELDRMHGLNWYDYGARNYDSTMGMFTSVDPLCEKNYHISPYAYCGGNPVNRVDPDGRDWYEFDEKGVLSPNIKIDRTQDVIIVHNPYKYNPDFDADFGNSEWKLVMPYGTINSNNSREKNNTAFLEINGDQGGSKIFEFLARATNSEWSQAKFGENEQGINVLTSSHNVDTEKGMLEYLLSGNAPKYIRELNHSHPNGHIEPSRNNNDNSNSNNGGDISFGKYFMSSHPEIKSFNIYVPTTNHYYNYTKYLVP